MCGSGLNDSLTIDLGNKNKLTSVNYTGGEAGGDNATITYSYQTFNKFVVTASGTFKSNDWVDDDNQAIVGDWYSVKSSELWIMDELFNIIGKLYVDIYNAQKVLDIMRQQLQDKENEIRKLQGDKSESLDEWGSGTITI